LAEERATRRRIEAEARKAEKLRLAEEKKRKAAEAKALKEQKIPKVVEGFGTSPIDLPNMKKTARTESRVRYSDKDLAEFRQIVQSKLDSARSELKYLQDQINNADSNGTDDTAARFVSLDDSALVMEKEHLSALAVRQLQFIKHLENAMQRIENKTYGICRVTGKLISKKRLRAVPHATLSIDAKMAQEG
jgi:RNA polymerase-binding transcription factor DksA